MTSNTLYGKTRLVILNNYWKMNVQWDFGNGSPVIRYSPDANLVPIHR
ncbi:hypothetical protein QFZ20_004674 [Flavobacterium sp. W4I14]|nr:hypothetical protein [Flavobacterium sp. W4I14]